MKTNTDSLEKRLQAYPQLRTKIEALLSVVENTDLTNTLANSAEKQVIEEMRQIGQQALQSWAETQHQKQLLLLREQKPNLRQHMKKNSIGTLVLDVYPSANKYSSKAKEKP